MSSEQEFKCVFCSEIFSQKEDLQTHFRKHADPNFNQKKQRGRFRDDNDSSREKPKDQVEVVECDVCPEVFSSISKAITHKHKIHPDHDTKYFCPWCGKLFTMKHLYKKHMHAAHSDREQGEDRLFHCDICDVDFFLPAAMLYHNKFYHRQDDLPNLGHSKKLKMIHEEVVQIYYCPFCGEEHENKVNLHKHINEEHMGENRSPDEVFRCPLCDAIFFYLDAYELHLTYHSIEDLYTERIAMMDEITDFSLETVQPLQERVENAEPSKDPEDPTIMGIENLFELTMDDPGNNINRKAKKHKKHKKSKKPAITLDEFLNMNKDVFGEGLDFQGVEEVPTQVITKRLKTKKVVPASQLVSSDLAKLKRQGIVVKKQSAKTGETAIKNNVALNSAGNTTNIIPQTKLDSFASSDPVLQKLLNQGSQIKIIKKSNQDSEENANTHDNKDKQKLSFNSLEDCNGQDSSVVKETEEKVIETSKENVESPETNSLKLMPLAESPNLENTSLISDVNLKSLQNCNKDSNHLDGVESKDLQKNTINSNDVTNLQNDSSTIKLSINLLPTAEEENLINQDTNIVTDGMNQSQKPDTYENTEVMSSVSASRNSSLDALKHLSNLLTIKSVNSNKAIPLPFHRSDNNSQKAEIPKTSLNSNNNSSNVTEVKQFSNFKKLDGITIKPTSKSHTLINHQSAESENILNEDDTWHEDKNNQTKIAEEKLPPIGKTPQLYVETKRLPKTSQKESPKGVLNVDHNSQSSADLLKHLKNVTAKPINTNSQKFSNLRSSPNPPKKITTMKTSVQKEVSEDGTEIFSIDDSDSDEGQCSTSNAEIKKECKIETNKSIAALQNANKNITIQPTTHQLTAKYDVAEHSNKMNKESESDDEFDKSGPEPRRAVKESNSKFGSPKPNQKNLAINNVLKNLSRNITVRSRNSSPSQSVRSQDHNSQDSDEDPKNAEDSDSDTPLSRVKITEMDNMSDDESRHSASDPNIKVEHPDDSHSSHSDIHNEPAPDDEELDDISDFESQIASTKLQNWNSTPNSKLNKLNPDTDLSTVSMDDTVKAKNNEHENKPADEIPTFAKNLGNQISIKQVKRPESKSGNVIEQPARQMNQSIVSQKMAVASNQVNTFNKEVKTVKTFQTQTKTVIQEITTTVTKTIKTLNQTTKQEVRNVAQSSSSSMITQKVQGNHLNFGQKNLQGVKVRQSVPNIRPKVRGQAPQTMRPAICAPPQATRLAISAPPQATRLAISAPVRANQIVPVRAALNRPSGPRPRIPNAMNMRPSTSGQQRPQMARPVKVSPRAVIASPNVPADPPGHFSCFKKPKESLIPEPDFSTTMKSEDDSPAQFSSTMQMSKSNFSSTSKVVKGNSVVTSTQTKSEVSASSQQLSKLRGMSGLVVKTSQTQAKQSHVEEKCEVSAKRNALEAIQKLQSQGLLVKKPRLDVNEDSNHSQHGSDDMEHFSNEEFDE